MSKFIGVYPPTWTKQFRNEFRAKHDNKCERCGHADDASKGYALTIHHLDNDKSNCEDWNLAALCQRCHLVVQGRVEMRQGWMFEHSSWMKPHIDGMNKALKQHG